MNKPSPKRMCIVCREMFDKRELIRVVKNKEGQFFVDETGKLAGRGAYICKSEQCLKNLQKSKGLNRAFKCAVPDEIYVELIEHAKR